MRPQRPRSQTNYTEVRRCRRHASTLPPLPMVFPTPAFPSPSSGGHGTGPRAAARRSRSRPRGPLLLPGGFHFTSPPQLFADHRTAKSYKTIHHHHHHHHHHYDGLEEKTALEISAARCLSDVFHSLVWRGSRGVPGRALVEEPPGPECTWGRLSALPQAQEPLNLCFEPLEAHSNDTDLWNA